VMLLVFFKWLVDDCVMVIFVEICLRLSSAGSRSYYLANCPQ
jgi:hypothetical protein